MASSAPLNNAPMEFNRLTLVFSGRHAYLEPHFRGHFFTSTLKQNRIVMLAGLIFYSIFGILDVIVVPQEHLSYWFIRWGVVCPCFVLSLLSSYHRRTYRQFHSMVAASAMIGGIGIIAMLHISAPYQNSLYEGGLVQIIFFLFAFARVRFVSATAVACTLVLAYLISFMMTGTLPDNYLIGKSFYLSVICLMGMMAGYTIEFQTRKNFFLSQKLESKKRRLAVANEFLEHRVTERTSELKRTNNLLKDEINERKMIETALRDSQTRYLRMVDNVTDYMCVYDLDGNILEANRQMISNLGYTFDELVHINYSNLIHPLKRASHFQYMIDIRDKGTAEGTTTLVTSDGEPRFFEYSNVLAEHTPGQQAVFSLARDVTHRKRTEKALADSQLQFQNIFETSAAGMAIVDQKSSQVVEINPAAAVMLGKSTDEIKGQQLEDLISISERSDIDHLPVQTQFPLECLLNKERDKSLPILVSTRTTLFDDRPHLIISFVNIQKIKEAEAEKRELERRSNRTRHLESIGTLAGGIAHDFNNILFGIMGFAELALEDATEESIQAKNLNEIIKGGHRAKEMISQILTFSRQESVEKLIIDPAPLIKEALKLIRATFPATIEIKSRYAAGLYRIKANPAQIHQVVMNLSTNAAHALPDQIGCIEVGITNVTLASDDITPHGELSKGDYLQIVVKDNGEGIPDEVIERIFEPYFTTKPQGEGNGMGLSVVLGIIQSLGGTIRVDSQAGQGTEFKILFPAAIDAAAPDEINEVPPAKGTEHIMVIDDERPLLVMLERMLKGLGYDVTTCQQPHEALEIFKSEPDSWDLVITDLTMPKMTGIQLAREVLDIRPGLPIVLCTGYNKKLSQSHLQNLGIRELLPKPVLKKELADAIRRAVEAN